MQEGLNLVPWEVEAERSKSLGLAWAIYETVPTNKLVLTMVGGASLGTCCGCPGLWGEPEN